MGSQHDRRYRGCILTFGMERKTRVLSCILHINFDLLLFSVVTSQSSTKSSHLLGALELCSACVPSEQYYYHCQYHDHYYNNYYHAN